MASKEELIEEMVDLNEEKTYSIVKELLDDDIEAREIINYLREAVDIIGDKYNKKEYFLTELVMAGELFQGSAEILEPYLKEEQKREETKGVVVVGTVKGDVHDIGKNIFITLLKSQGFEVHDLGVDVPPEEFLKKVKETDANYIGYSGLLTVALENMKKTTELLKSNGLRDHVKIIIGGLPVDEMWMKEAGADAFTDNAFEGVEIIKKWAEEDNE
jgi:dimethylamine corrinoid protein